MSTNLLDSTLHLHDFRGVLNIREKFQDVFFFAPTFLPSYHLIGLVVKASVSRAEDPRFESRFRRDFFSGSSHTSDLKIGTPVATLSGAWHYRFSVGTGRARCQYTVTG